MVIESWRNVHDEYGPNSQEAASALMVLNKTRWLEHVGLPWQERLLGTLNDVVIVQSWNEALTIFDGTS